MKFIFNIFGNCVAVAIIVQYEKKINKTKQARFFEEEAMHSSPSLNSVQIKSDSSFYGVITEHRK